MKQVSLYTVSSRMADQIEYFKDKDCRDGWAANIADAFAFIGRIVLTTKDHIDNEKEVSNLFNLLTNLKEQVDLFHEEARVRLWQRE